MGKKKPKANGHKSAEKPPGCYVLSLKVKNIRCFGDKEQELDCSDGKGRPRQWTVILGDNGTGKTTLLQAIAGHQCEPETYRDDTTKVQVTFQNPKLFRFAARFNRGLSDKGDGTSELSAVSKSGLTSDGGEEKTGRWQRTSVYGNRYDGLLHNFVVNGYGMYRDLGTADVGVGGVAEVAADSATTLFNPAARLPDAESWLLNLDYSSKFSGNRKQSDLLLQILSLLVGVLPEVREIRFEPGVGVVPRPRVEFLTPYGWVPLRQLGHGYQTMIAWVVDFVSRMVERYPDSDNPLAEPAVCLVDEIDLHLHPVWQRKVIGYLSERFPNTQFIVTAHSPLVVQAAASADANIAVLTRSEKPDADGHHYVEIKNNPEDVKNWRLDQILTSDLFGGIDLRSIETENLFARKRELLAKPRRTKVEDADLAKIDAEIATLPVGDSEKIARELDLLKRATAELKSSRKP